MLNELTPLTLVLILVDNCISDDTREQVWRALVNNVGEPNANQMLIAAEHCYPEIARKVFLNAQA